MFVFAAFLFVLS